MHATGWSRGLDVTGGGSGVVSHAGLSLLRQLSDRTGLTSGLSAALPSPLGGHDRGRVFSNLACAIADGARVISDFRVPGQAWQIAIHRRGEVRERRADDACADVRCAHRTCWVEEAHVAELTGLLREGPGGDQLQGWPARMRILARRERPHPGAQLTLFEAEDGWRYSLWVTNRAAATRGWLGQNAYIDAAHRVQARVEDAIRTGKDTGLGHFPSFDFQVNAAWLTAAMIASILLAWLKLLALDGDLATAEPKTLRYRVLHTAARLVRGGRKRHLRIQATWPWAEAITAAWQRIDALPHAP